MGTLNLGSRKTCLLIEVILTPKKPFSISGEMPVARIYRKCRDNTIVFLRDYLIYCLIVAHGPLI
jgi:hypothetical protein